jgi:hypothetical protein
MSDMQIRGPLWGGQGTPVPFTAAYSGAQRTADAHGRYADAVLGNRCYYLSVAAAAATAYVGAAGGTPLLAIHNPANSNKTLLGLMVGWSGRVGASAVGNSGLDIWAGVSALPTGSITVPTNARSQARAGSSAVGFVNTALTGSTALALALPLLDYQLIGATPVSQSVTAALFDLAGIVVADPGNQIAIGFTVALTSLTSDIALYWEELPFQPAM